MSAPISYSMAGAVTASGLSQTSLKRAIATGRLRAKKSDVDDDGNPSGVWVIPHVELEKFVASLVDA